MLHSQHDFDVKKDQRQKAIIYNVILLARKKKSGLVCFCGYF
jgi:hypothetical protein